MSRLLLFSLLLLCLGCDQSEKPSTTPSMEKMDSSIDTLQITNVIFESEGIKLAGTMYIPPKAQAAIVLVHGSDSVPRMTKFAEHLASNDMAVLTYDKRGVAESEGIYAGPEVGTNNISVENLNLLAKDANAAVNMLHKHAPNLPVALVGFSQAGWIIPIAASENPLVDFMVLFSCPTITTLEQLRFQFYTNGQSDFWEKHTEAEAREHVKNDPDRYDFEPTDPKESLSKLSIPGLWLFGEQDIQIPVKMCMEQLDNLKQQNKPFEYTLFPTYGHNTNKTDAVDIAIDWIKETAKRKRSN